MATIIEAFEAAKAGKVVLCQGAKAVIYHNEFIFVMCGEKVELNPSTIYGWTIEEPAPPEPEWVDVPVSFYKTHPPQVMVKAPTGWVKLKNIEEEPGFAGYGYYCYVEDRKVSIIWNAPFGFGDPNSALFPFTNTGPIRWCDFVRFDKSMS